MKKYLSSLLLCVFAIAGVAQINNPTGFAPLAGTATNQNGGTVNATTLAASSTVSGTGFTNYLASPPSIGNTVANSGVFTSLKFNSNLTDIGSRIIISNTAPTISSGFGTGPTITGNNTASMRINVGTGGTATGGVVGLPAAANGWNCQVDELNPNSTAILARTIITASTTTTVTLANILISTGIATAWQASQVLIMNCMGY